MTESTYSIEELPGVTVAAGAEIDLLDQSLPDYFESFADAKAALTTLETGKLRQDIVAGTIAIVEIQPEGGCARAES